MTSNSTLILSGCSAGGQGVINVIDYVSGYVESQIAGATVLGLADAGTRVFLLVSQFAPLGRISLIPLADFI